MNYLHVSCISYDNCTYYIIYAKERCLLFLQNIVDISSLLIEIPYTKKV